MVKGLDVFRDYFAGHAEQFVLIGGTAATLAMEDAGLAFRATKDLDIPVLGYRREKINNPATCSILAACVLKILF